MTFRAEGWPRVREVFESALALPAGQRGAYVAGECGTEPVFREQVERLLAAHREAGDFLETPPPAPDEGLAAAPRPAVTGRTVGPFRLLESIGSGGMGVVYRADRVDGGFEQQVAIKIIAVALHDAEALSRFRIERQILAALNHPNIVQFIDGGLTGDGQAFLVMELVEGVRVTEFCRDRRLPLDARLQLVERICGAVQYAHQHGVLHCDLKPANILVTPDAVVKVLDFGVAKLVAAGTDAAERTATGLRPFTPDYASPEQLRGLPVTIASDIYALGVLLYEIVTGHRPYETGGKGIEQVLEMVVTRDPERPSQALAGSTAPPPYEGRVLRGDLDAIVMKAMHKDPAHRYASAQELANDLARYRASEPVLAREPSLGYLLLKSARRHRAAAAAVAVSLLAVLAALGVSIWQTQRVAAARDRAEARFNDARQIANALIFKVHDSIAEVPGTMPARKMIVAEALGYLERLSRDPSVDDGLRMELAAAYSRIGDVQGNPARPNLGDPAGARASYEQAIRLLRPLASGLAPTTPAMQQLGTVELRLADVVGEPEALATTRSAIAMAERILLTRPADAAARTLLANGYFGLALQVPRSEVLPLWTRAAEMYESLLGEMPDDPVRQRNVALVEKYLGAYYEREKDLVAALAHYSRARELDERRLAAAPQNRGAIFDVAIDVGNVAAVDWNLGRLDAAEQGFRRSLAMREMLSALDPRDVQAQSRVAFMHARLTHLYLDMMRRQDALVHARKAVEVEEKQAAPQRDPFVFYLSKLGEVETSAGNRAAGCRAFRRSSTLLAQITQASGGGGSSALTPPLRDLQALLGKALGTCGAPVPATNGGGRR